MKKIVTLLVLSVAVVGIAAAQPWQAPYGQFQNQGGPMMGRGFGLAQQPAEAPKAATIEGKLVFVDGHPAVQTKDKTYMVRLPRFYYYAYTDGIKEGAQVKAEGYELPALPGQDKPYFAVTKATIGSKTYDFATLGAGGMFGGMNGPMGGRGGMMDRHGGAMGGRGRR
jgi:hypothetical protein